MSLQSRVRTGQHPDLRPARFRGRMQLIRAAIAMMCGTLVCIGCWLTWGQVADVMALGRGGNSINAQIYNLDHERDLGSASAGNIYYAFRVSNSQPVTGQFSASRKELRKVRIGRRLLITYLPSNPRVYRLGRFGKVQAVWEASQTLVLFTLASMGLFTPLLFVEYHLRRQLRLARTGICTTGEITGCLPLARRAGFQVSYTVPLADGGSVCGKATLSRRMGEPTLVGFPISVLYNPQHPEENRPMASFVWIQF